MMCAVSKVQCADGIARYTFGSAKCAVGSALSDLERGTSLQPIVVYNIGV